LIRSAAATIEDHQRASAGEFGNVVDYSRNNNRDCSLRLAASENYTLVTLCWDRAGLTVIVIGRTGNNGKSSNESSEEKESIFQLYSIKPPENMIPNAPELARTQGTLWFLISNK